MPSTRFATVVGPILSLVAIWASPVLLEAQGREWRFSAKSGGALPLPTWTAEDSIRRALSYPDAPDSPIDGFLADLNHDGTQDYVLRSSADACGTNCDYLLIDGRSMQVLGRVGGSVIFVGPSVVSGYPVLHAYGHRSADAGTWTTLVFDGETYAAIGSVYLEGESAARLFDSLRDVPCGPGEGADAPGSGGVAIASGEPLEPGLRNSIA